MARRARTAAAAGRADPDASTGGKTNVVDGGAGGSSDVPDATISVGGATGSPGLDGGTDAGDAGAPTRCDSVEHDDVGNAYADDDSGGENILLATGPTTILSDRSTTGTTTRSTRMYWFCLPEESDVLVKSTCPAETRSRK